ncbi:hypothetical protein HS088_TW04G00016 [Tripterygium wilfordii]|uniref:Beta-lactamase-related domain-containing protein n=1 Tax=Tripterygium wilfordii TaxID=458696 RepID=A0A7J7DNZ5_TRIWF|nr:beta-lactamase domain-containing protein 2-like [Tripterygium wilfordii]KAF5748068.1 hypothetical protein HS088_TW04G00016 [Tripterygium wilfordii]
MRPSAESVGGDINNGPVVNSQWIFDTPVHSDTEVKLRQLLLELGNENKILGVQVCAYKDGEVIIDTAAGALGGDDPRPVQPDSLFSVFSVTKGITAGMLHWLVDNGKLKLDENVANIWPEFGTNGKDRIKVHHVLNHTSGLHNALADLRQENPLLMCDWDECLKRIAMSAPETEPGQKQLYHYISFGWLCGGIIERASGKKFQEILEEAFIHPLKIEGELYVGIPPGVKSRLAELTLDTSDLREISAVSSRVDLPSTFQPSNMAKLAATMPALFNMLDIRRAIIPAANGHCSARALARYYATLATGGVIPPPHSSSSRPPLGSHPHIPDFPRGNNSSECDNITSNGIPQNKDVSKIFSDLKVHDTFMGVGEYRNLVLPNGKFGLGFRRFSSNDGSFTCFGHSGSGGSTGFCDIRNRFAIAVTLNKMSFGDVTRKIVQLVCSELNIPSPDEFSGPN